MTIFGWMISCLDLTCSFSSSTWLLVFTRVATFLFLFLLTALFLSIFLFVFLKISFLGLVSQEAELAGTIIISVLEYPLWVAGKTTTNESSSIFSIVPWCFYILIFCGAFSKELYCNFSFGMGFFIDIIFKTIKVAVIVSMCKAIVWISWEILPIECFLLSICFIVLAIVSVFYQIITWIFSHPTFSKTLFFIRKSIFSNLHRLTHSIKEFVNNVFIKT